MRTQIFIFIAILAVFTAYAVLRLGTGLPWVEQHMALSWLIFFFVEMLGPFGDRLLFPRLGKKFAPLVFAIDWVSYLVFGLMSLAVAFGIVADVAGLLLKVVLSSSTEAVDHWVHIAFLATVSVSLLVGLWGVYGGPFVKRVDIRLQKLPAGFDGFTIAQITDLHVGPTIKRGYTRKVVDIVNGLKPDMVALTGDFIDGSVEGLSADTAPLGDLKAPHGAFFVTGNHEHYWNARAWMQEFARLGATVLYNEFKILRKGSDEIVLAGVPDWAAGDSSPQKSLNGAPQDAVKILLAHQPGAYRAAEEAGFDVQLSGHSHAGQYFPFTLMVRFFQHFYKGLNRYKNLQVYVSNGTGYWGPPLRAGAPAEVTLITLRRG